jgi:hypothetical protein
VGDRQQEDEQVDLVDHVRREQRLLAGVAKVCVALGRAAQKVAARVAAGGGGVATAVLAAAVLAGGGLGLRRPRQPVARGVVGDADVQHGVLHRGQEHGDKAQQEELLLDEVDHGQKPGRPRVAAALAPFVLEPLGAVLEQHLAGEGVAAAGAAGQGHARARGSGAGARQPRHATRGGRAAAR